MAKNQLTKEDAETKFLNEVSHELTVPDIQFEFAVKKELTERLSLCLESLSYRERLVVEQRMQEATLDEVGYVLKVTRERVRQIEGKAIRKLMLPGIAQKLFTFLDR